MNLRANWVDGQALAHGSGSSYGSCAAEQRCAAGVFGLARLPLARFARSGGNCFFNLGLGFVADQGRRALCRPQALFDSGS